MSRVTCPCCKTKIVPLPMSRGDVLNVRSADGYILDDRYSVSVPKGWIRTICWNCKYTLREEKED